MVDFCRNIIKIRREVRNLLFIFYSDGRESVSLNKSGKRVVVGLLSILLLTRREPVFDLLLRSSALHLAYSTFYARRRRRRRAWSNKE